MEAPFSSSPLSDSSQSLTPSSLQSEHTFWTSEENKLFEIAIAEFDSDSPELLFDQIASKLPSKTISQIENHYKALLEDIEKIECDLIPVPDYVEKIEYDLIPVPDCVDNGEKSGEPMVENKTDCQKRRRKGVLWSDQEHELFLEGLKKYGKGDWRSISRNCVLSRTPTQVASHAQKYFIRLRNNENSISALAPSKPWTSQGPSMASPHS